MFGLISWVLLCDDTHWTIHAVTRRVLLCDDTLGYSFAAYEPLIRSTTDFGTFSSVIRRGPRPHAVYWIFALTLHIGYSLLFIFAGLPFLAERRLYVRVET